MNHYRGSEQRYMGAVPTPFAIYRPAGVGMARSLEPSMLGIGSYMSVADLEPLSVIGEYATLQAEVRARKKDLHNEFGIKPFDAPAQAEWASLTELDDELTRRITEYSARKSALEVLVGTPAAADGPFVPSTRQTKPQHARRVPEDIFALDQYRSLSGSQDELLQAYRDGAMFAVERATYPHPESVPATEQAHIARLLDTADIPSQHNPNRELAQRILATGTNDYLRMFTKYIQGRQLNERDLRAAAPLTVQTDATGGYAVPFYFDPTLLHIGAWTTINPYRQTCTVKTIVGTDTFNGATIAAFTVGRAAEAAAAVEGAGAVGQITAIVGKVHGMGTLSMELLQDRPDITSELASLIAEAKDTEEESIFTIGTGSALGAGFNPIGALAPGVTTGAYTSLNTITSVTLAAGDADATEAALPIRHRSKGAWFMSRAAIRQWQALETSGGKLFGGQYYARVGNPAIDRTGNTGMTLLDYPIWEVPSGPSGLVTTTVVSLLMNPASFYIIERAGMTVETIPVMLDATTGYPTGQRGIYAWWRNTAKPADVNAGRRLKIT